MEDNQENLEGSRSRLLESENDDNQSDYSNVSSDSQILENQGSVTGTIQKQLKYFSRRLSQLGLEGEAEVPSEVVRLQDPPLATSRILQRLPEATNKVVEKTQKEQLHNSNLDEKINIKFQPIGNIPVLLPSVCKISSNQKFSVILAFLKKRLKLKFVYCYINNSFAPNPHQIVGELWEQFKVKDELIVSYCGSVAFG
ncbi:hypothetical protein TBLA_0A09980 [Henningerozyma blattae CBS 6284]|uniref:Ubiquitin-like protein ATG12 n=1 Tax=Henningerozyma blattae (strain ATCC 34711 / CBS 6284 / DSM 70876 / NBRC 10599 / NRRL Y-10934 / UCD 77-7) TaxID=1071380 RepID=I2GXC6_HENB6|nr:hypothetical protein TBLA_0A09980 [Tetrapisispora blattae CBS 6284]CCH58778.1 hypothetical protein TBLA_0A09980 [Tetrapisispora blattae CBS 6284]